jgi:hypothetical protein
MKPIGHYVDEHGILIDVYPEKKVKRTPWQRGEAYLGVKKRIPEDTGMIMHQFTRKNGKY